MPGHTRRLQIDVRPALLARFSRLVQLGGLRSERELLDAAVTVLEWAVDQRVAGRLVGSVDESAGMFRELYTAYLEACRANAAATPLSRVNTAATALDSRSVAAMSAPTDRRLVDAVPLCTSTRSE